jgi:GT2 family glycosyltransferase
MLKRCLRSVKANTHVPYGLIISDDNSPDAEMQAYLDKLEHEYNVLRNDAQLGFPANVNQAVEFSDADFICLLNSDTRVCVGWLEALLDEMESPDVGIVGCKLVYPNEKEPPWGGTIQHAGVAKGQQGPYHIWRGMPKDYPPANVRREVNCVTFACALIRRTLWDELEGLDEGYKGGQFEDVSFSWTARELGWKVVYTPKAVVYHYEHGSGEEWVKKSESPNRRRLNEQFPNQPDDVQLFESLDKTEEGIAAFVHQIRSAAIFHTIGFRNKLDHPLRLATMSYDELPEVEREWAREHAKRLLEVLK